jgi:uncharacterized protein YabN with tetrapyrrole methylase and pyrophosphatase domain
MMEEESQSYTRITMRPASTPDLFIIGLGILVPDHVTVEATAAMSVCDQIFSIVQEPRAIWLPTGNGMARRFINLLPFYEEQALRTTNYFRVSEMVVSELRPGSSAAYVTYGNPMVFDRVAHNLVETCKQKGLKVRIIPGISSLDTVLCDLRLDLAPGMQIYDASSLVTHSIEPNVTIPLLLIQVGAFGSLRTQYRRRQTGNSLMALQNYLLRFYSETHNVTLVRTGRSTESDLAPTSLGQLSQVSADVLSGSSLYIPASQQPRLNLELVKRMERLGSDL